MSLFICPHSWGQYQFDFWTADQGLPQNIVRDVRQTTDGYLWIATLDGLGRFDGVRFTIFNTSTSPGIHSNRFTCLYEAADGELWAGVENGDVTRYTQGRFSTLSTEQGLIGSSIRGVTGDKYGHLWVLSGNRILAWANGRFVPVITPAFPGNSGFSFSVVQNSRPGGFWSWGTGGLSVFSDGQVATYSRESGLPSLNVRSVARDEEGALWVSTDAGLATIRSGRVVKVYRTGNGLPSYDLSFVSGSRLRLVCRDRRGALTLIDLQSWRHEDIGRPPVSPPEYLQQSVFYEDGEGNVWIGTNGQGLCRVRRQAITVVSEQDGVRNYNVYPVYQDRAGAIWVGTSLGVVSRFQNGRFKNYGTLQGLGGQMITALLEDSSGRLWVGAYGGSNSIRVLERGRFRQPNFLPDLGTVAAIYEDNQGALWFGSERKLARYKEGVLKTWTAPDGLAGNDVRVIIQNEGGDLWIGGYGGLTSFHNGKFTSYRARDGLPSNNVRALYQDREGVLWIGTYDGGLGRLEHGHFTRYTVREGLFNDGVFQILEDAQGNFWMSSNRGIYRVSKAELNEFAAGRRSFVTSVAYGRGDGMRNVECNGGTWPAGVRAFDGSLWFPTQDGIVMIRPQTVSINRRPPPVRIESLRLDRDSVDIQAPVKVEPGRVNWEIQYTALSFIRPEQINFRYKLEGLDQDWIWAGTRRTAYYSRVPPGKYRFRVIAANSDGVWNENGADVEFIVRPAFFRTWWFAALVLSAISATALFGYRYRINQLEQLHAVQEAFARQLLSSQEGERRRIASELHDSLGQSLVIIRNWALLGSSQLSPLAPAKDELDEITNTAAQAIHEVREIAYNLGPFHLDRLGLANTIRDMCQRIGQASNIRFTAHLDLGDLTLSRETEINLYRIAQEAINNLVKHSGATEAEVTLLQENDAVKLRIADNGRGFARQNLGKPAGQSGFGLTGMAERVRLLNGTWLIRSSPERGTTIEVTLKRGPNDETASRRNRG